MAVANSRKRRADHINSDEVPATKSRTRLIASKVLRSELEKGSTQGQLDLPQASNEDESTVLQSVATIRSVKSNKRGHESEDISTPKHKRINTTLLLSPEQTPTRGASRLFDKLSFTTNAMKPASDEACKAYSSPPLTPSSRNYNIESLPPVVADLITIFTAFLNAYSLYLAHHGAGTPLHMSQLLVSVTSTYKKRAVQASEIRRLLGVLGGRLSPVDLVDTKDGRISVEARDMAAQSVALRTRQLVEDFEAALGRRWAGWCQRDDEAASNPELFVNSLPLAPIEVSEVAVDASKMTRGARRLHEIRRGADANGPVQLRPRTTMLNEAARTTVGVDQRGGSLIDRILLKAARASEADRGPTKLELEKMAALDRVEEATLLFGLLLGGRPRASFSMQAIVQHMTSSMRNSIAKEEAELCVRLMAKEVSPRFVTLLESGALRGVVLARTGRMGQMELRERVNKVRSSVRGLP